MLIIFDYLTQFLMLGDQPFQSLERRFVQAMEQIAKLSLDKEQLEHLVERLQIETG